MAETTRKRPVPSWGITKADLMRMHGEEVAKLNARIVALESLTGRAGNEGSGKDARQRVSPLLSPRPDSGLTRLKEAVEALQEKKQENIRKWKREPKDSPIKRGIDYNTAAISALQEVIALIEEREQASK